MYEQISANKRRTAVMILLFALLIAGVVVVINYVAGYGTVGVVVAVIVAGTASLVSYYNSDKVALAMSRARPADPKEYARYHNLVEGLCISGVFPSRVSTSSTTRRRTRSPQAATRSTPRSP
ncbi:MAG: hypothetical protein M5T61_11110 [Acidimicrobiia bacterium]|nr:hypothetical protein [Acidimicrobiia bacterium]